MSETIDIAPAGGTPGANTTELTMFDSTVAFPGVGLSALGLKRVSWGGQISHAGHIKAYFSNNKGVTWRLFDDDAVAASGAGTPAGPIDYDVAPYDDVKLTWTNDAATAETTWDIHLKGHFDRQPAS